MTTAGATSTSGKNTHTCGHVVRFGDSYLPSTSGKNTHTCGLVVEVGDARVMSATTHVVAVSDGGASATHAAEIDDARGTLARLKPPRVIARLRNPKNVSPKNTTGDHCRKKHTVIYFYLSRFGRFGVQNNSQQFLNLLFEFSQARSLEWQHDQKLLCANGKGASIGYHKVQIHVFKPRGSISVFESTEKVDPDRRLCPPDPDRGSLFIL
jgi:hypothetical protein